MPAAEYSFVIEKGTSFVISFEYKDDTNIPINISNWCARIRWIEDQASPVIRTFTTTTRNSDYEFTIDPLLGKVVLKLGAAFTASFILSRIPILISAPFEEKEEENKKAIFLFLFHFRGGLDKKKENDLNLNL